MNTTSKNNTKAQHENERQETIKRARARRLHKAQELAIRYKPQVDGSILIQRFNRTERIQHFVLIVSFITLGFTGLMQTYSWWPPTAWVINVIFGGVETLRIIHHIAAIVFSIQTILHGMEILYTWIVKREWGSMMPAISDLTGLIGMLKYNLGLAKSRPKFDRFSIEEKVEYWALWWGAICMGVTGLFQWYPTLVTSIFPGNIVPMARLIHTLEAILAVSAIAIWHTYHTVIKERNTSIFTGYMTEHEMQENHPEEYRRILSAKEFLQNYKNSQLPKSENSENGPAESSESNHHEEESLRINDETAGA